MSGIGGLSGNIHAREYECILSMAPGAATECVTVRKMIEKRRRKMEEAGQGEAESKKGNMKIWNL